MNEINDVLDAPEYDEIPVRYAGFWLRLAAYLLDSLILTVPYYIILFLFIGSPSSIQDPEVFMEKANSMSFLGFLFAVVVIAYFAYFESSARQATFGKSAVGIKVTGLNGKRISFGRAIGRYFAKIVSGIIFLIGFIMAGFTEKKQALHDMIASTLVVMK